MNVVSRIHTLLSSPIKTESSIPLIELLANIWPVEPQVPLPGSCAILK